MAEHDRCQERDNGKQCRMKLHAQGEHRWWSSMTGEKHAWGGSAPHVEPKTLQEAMARDLRELGVAPIAKTRSKKVADVDVTDCYRCPMFEAVLDRCSHPGMGPYGRTVTMQEAHGIPDFCPLRLVPLTIGVAA